MKLGAWTRRPSYDDIRLAARLGLTRLDIMLNDFSKARTFTKFARDDVGDKCRFATDLGLEVHLTSWLMPHETFILYAADSLCQDAIDWGAHSVLWDAEEPWTQAIQPMDRGAAAELLSQKMCGCRMGVTGIGYAWKSRIGPLVDVCDYIVPQCYATSSSGNVQPHDLGALVAHWREFAPDKPLVGGLAAYRQVGVDGYTAYDAMRESFRQMQHAGAEGVVWWSLRHIRGSKVVQMAIETIAKAMRQ